MKFGMLEMKCLLSKVLRNFQIFVAPGYEPILVAALTLKSENGVCVVLKERR